MSVSCSWRRNDGGTCVILWLTGMTMARIARRELRMLSRQDHHHGFTADSRTSD